MRSISVSMITLATALVACNRGKPLPDMSEVSSVAASAAPVAEPAPAPPPPPVQGPVTDATPLYEIDSEAQRAPSPGSGLDRIIKGLHVRVCVRADVAPFASLSVNGLDGFEVDLASKIVEQISIDYKQPLKIDWVVVSAAERLKRLQEDSCDFLVGSLSYTAERAKEVALSKPYLKTDKVILSAAKVTRKVPVIAKVGGTTGDLGQIKGTERLFGTYQEIVYAMDAEEIDYLVTDRPIADQLVRSSSKPYSVWKTLASGAESYVAATRNGQPELLGAVNNALDDLARSGRLAQIHRRWI
jgi:ABC-type amino acid transport substrate-binding protein